MTRIYPWVLACGDHAGALSVLCVYSVFTISRCMAASWALAFSSLKALEAPLREFHEFNKACVRSETIPNVSSRYLEKIYLCVTVTETTFSRRETTFEFHFQYHYLTWYHFAQEQGHGSFWIVASLGLLCTYLLLGSYYENYGSLGKQLGTRAQESGSWVQIPTLLGYFAERVAFDKSVHLNLLSGKWG